MNVLTYAVRDLFRGARLFSNPAVENLASAGSQARAGPGPGKPDEGPPWDQGCAPGASDLGALLGYGQKTQDAGPDRPDL